jgi:hypothetical protein
VPEVRSLARLARAVLSASPNTEMTSQHLAIAGEQPSQARVEPIISADSLETLSHALIHDGCPNSWTLTKLVRVVGTIEIVRLCGFGWEGWTKRQRQRRVAELRQLLASDRSQWRRYGAGGPS